MERDDLDSDREGRRLRQKAETAGSLAPRQMDRALYRSTPPPRRGWGQLGRAEMYALAQSQLVMWVLYLVVGYLFATRLSLGLGIAFVAILVALYGWIFLRVSRR